MALKKCQRCEEEKTTAHFIACNSKIHNGSLPICRECLSKIIAAAPPEKNWNIVDKICQWADIPFIPDEWAKIYSGHGKDAFGVYASIFRSEPYKTLDWQAYNEVYLQIEEEKRVEDAIPTIKAEQIKKLQQKWGLQYDDENLEYLENLHKGLLNSQNVVGALNEDQALKLCKISLIIEQKIRAGLDFSKDLKAYDELAKLANLTPKNVKDADEFSSFAETGAYLEKTGWIPKYYDGAVRDEVDNVLKNIKMWNQYLYVNETGIAEEIEQRIENLKVAAELEGETFNEAEFRKYMENQGDIDSLADQEEFHIEL